MSVPKITHRVINKTSSYNIESKRDRSGTIFTNRGATGAITITLPPPNRLIGYDYVFVCIAAQAILVATRTPDTLVAPGDAAADSLSINTIGATTRFLCDGIQWIAMTESVGSVGTVAT